MMRMRCCKALPALVHLHRGRVIDSIPRGLLLDRSLSSSSSQRGSGSHQLHTTSTVQGGNVDSFSYPRGNNGSGVKISLAPPPPPPPPVTNSVSALGGDLDRKWNRRAKAVPGIPFTVKRTASNRLPVYLRSRQNGTLLTTSIRHIQGDVQVLMAELKFLCESPVRLRAGSVEVQGSHVRNITQWLANIGF